MTEALIIYTSLTGNTEACADMMADALEELGVGVEVLDVYDAGADEFLDFDICIVGSYAYGGHGELPDEMVGFYEELGQLDLSGKVYATFGSGDEFYEVFCGPVDDFDQQFQATGAVRGGQGVKVNLDPDEDDRQRFQTLAESILSTLQSL